MSYRVEAASTGRAGCQSTECKSAGRKIDKDDLRCGTWLEGPNFSGWKWRHWGCVSGKVLQNIRKNLDPEKDGAFDWDLMDGLIGDGKTDLTQHPELQEKVKRCITQGFIDPEDFNGDPEMNKLGLDGLRSKESKQALRDYAKKTKTLSEAIELKETEYAQAKKDGNAARIKELDDELNTLKREEADHVASNPVAFKGTESAKKPTTKKRGRGKQESDDEDVKPAKKSRGKAKKEDSDNEDVKPANKSRGKAKKEESDDEDVKPAKKSRRKVKREESDDEEVVPTKTSRGKVKKEESDGDKAPLVEKTPGKARKAGGNVIKDEDELDSVPASPKRVAKGSKAIKKEERNDGELVLKQEDADEPGALLHTKQPAARGKKAIKEEDTEAGFRAETKSKPASRKGSKKAANTKQAVKDEGTVVDSEATGSAATPEPAKASVKNNTDLIGSVVDPEDDEDDYEDKPYPGTDIWRFRKNIVPQYMNSELLALYTASYGRDWNDTEIWTYKPFLDWVEELKEDMKEKPIKNTKAKKAKTPAAKSTRASRSRTASGI